MVASEGLGVGLSERGKRRLNSKHRWLVCVLMGSLLLSGCASSEFRDQQVYIVNRGEHPAEKKELLDWLSVKGPNPFNESAWPTGSLAKGEIPLFYDKGREYLYFMRGSNGSGDLVGEVLQGGTDERIDVFAVNLKNGERTLVGDRLPFISKVLTKDKPDRVYFLAGGELWRLDLRRDLLIPETEANAAGPLSDVFAAPLENGKLYLNLLGMSEGGTYYPDSGRLFSLYQTKDRIYYKGLLEAPYYYATEWRSSENDVEGELWSLIVDNKGNVIRLLAKGSFSDAMGKGVLILGQHQFGLRFIPDVNVPEKNHVLSEDYIYDCGFLPGGEMYAIGDDPALSGGYRLYFYDDKGRRKETLPISGSRLFVDARGAFGYSNGPHREMVDLKEKIIQENLDVYPRNHRLSAEMRTALRLFLTDYGSYLLGDRSKEEALQAWASNEAVMDGLLMPGMASNDLGRTHFYMRIDDGSIGYDGQSGQFKVRFLGMSEEGKAFRREVTLRMAYQQRWQVTMFDAVDDWKG